MYCNLFLTLKLVWILSWVDSEIWRFLYFCDYSYEKVLVLKMSIDKFHTFFVYWIKSENPTWFSLVGIKVYSEDICLPLYLRLSLSPTSKKTRFYFVMSAAAGRSELTVDGEDAMMNKKFPRELLFFFTI